MKIIYLKIWGKSRHEIHCNLLILRFPITRILRVSRQEALKNKRRTKNEKNKIELFFKPAYEIFQKYFPESFLKQIVYLSQPTNISMHSGVKSGNWNVEKIFLYFYLTHRNMFLNILVEILQIFRTSSY